MKFAEGATTLRRSCRSTVRPRLCFGLLCVGLIVVAARAESPKTDGDVFRFTDVTAEVGLKTALHGAFNHAIAWGDFDNDGRVDVFLGNFADRGSAANYGLAK